MFIEKPLILEITYCWRAGVGGKKGMAGTVLGAF